MIWPFRKKKKPEPVATTKAEPPRKRISLAVMAKAAEKKTEAIRQFEPYQPPSGVIPPDKKAQVLAMDETPYDYINNAYINNHFPGYQYLAQLAQLPEYRKMAETIAEEMTRKWITLTSTGEDDKTDKLTHLEEALKRFKVRALFQKAKESDDFYGRGQIYLELDKPSGGVASEDPEELQAPLFVAPAKIKKGSLKALRLIEPVWTYPGNYNSSDPLAPNFYKPNLWYVMGKTVHDSRLLTFVSREVPDLLKASYNFGGLSLSQMAQPAVQNWMRTRDSVGDTVHSFSLTILKTIMATVLSGGADEGIFDRMDLFNSVRDNRGLMAIDKDSEEIDQVNTPLTGLDALQAQAQEHMAAVASIPLVKLLGITPSGLNASSDGEIRVFYDHITALQETTFRDPLTKVLNIIQLSEFGEIDPDITFTFEPLYELNDVEKATVRKTDADTDSVLITSGVIAPDESRARIAADPESGYNGLDLNVEIEEPDEEDDQPAMDSNHWITLENGEHALINGEGEVVGGAGGNLKGKKLSNVKKKSPDVESHVKNTESIAKQGAKKFGGDPKEYIRKSSEFAHQYEKTGNIPEGLEKPSNNLTQPEKERTVPSQSNKSEGGEMEHRNNLSELSESEKSSLTKVGPVSGFSPKPDKNDLKTLIEKGFVSEVKGTGAMTGRMIHELTEKGKEAYESIIKERKEKSEKSASKEAVEVKPKSIKPEKNEAVKVLEFHGGKEWIDGNKHRVYFNDPMKSTGSDFGSKNKNFKANNGKLFYDVVTGEFHYDGSSEFRDEIINNAKKLLTV